MKKPNINVNVDAIKQWGIEHGEKVALGIVGVLFLYFAFGFLTTDTYDGTTEQLSTTADKAEQKLSDPESWNKGGEAPSFENLPYDEMAKDLTTPIDPEKDGFAWRDQQGQRVLFTTLNVTSGRAREPEYLPPVDVVATAGRSGFEVIEEREDNDRRRDRRRPNRRNRNNDDDEDEDDDNDRRRRARKEVEGYRWVAVRAAVPLGLQYGKYREANIAGPRTRGAEPQYKGFVLHRRELTSSETWSEWAEVDRRAIANVIPRVRMGGNEVVALNETHERITAPLPAREQGEWTAREVGHPQFDSPDPEEIAEEVVEDEPEVDPDAAERDDFGRPINRARAGRQDRAAKARAEALAKRQARNRGAAVSRDDEYVLFRTFDFTAEPGQCYQYRVQLVLENPNFGKSAREVQRTAGAEQQPNEGRERHTPWSAPGMAVCVPPDINYYVMAFVPNRGQKGSVEIDLVSWDEESGEFESQNLHVTQGQVISTRGRTAISMPDFVLDYTGGPVSLSQIDGFEEELPAEMLVVNESGEMIVRSERADDDAHATIQRRTTRPSRDRDDDSEDDDTDRAGRVSF